MTVRDDMATGCTGEKKKVCRVTKKIGNTT